MDERMQAGFPAVIPPRRFDSSEEAPKSTINSTRNGLFLGVLAAALAVTSCNCDPAPQPPKGSTTAPSAPSSSKTSSSSSRKVIHIQPPPDKNCSSPISMEWNAHQATGLYVCRADISTSIRKPSIHADTIMCPSLTVDHTVPTEAVFICPQGQVQKYRTPELLTSLPTDQGQIVDIPSEKGCKPQAIQVTPEIVVGFFTCDPKTVAFKAVTCPDARTNGKSVWCAAGGGKFLDLGMDPQ